MATKTKSFLMNRAAQPASASDEDFAIAIGTISPSAANRPVYSQNIPIERISKNPFQARQTFNGLEELAEVIREQGFISRLRVRPDPATDGLFQLVYGERRLRAAKIAGLQELPCDVANHTDAELVEIGLAENIQRQDLNPLEEAEALRKFTEVGHYTIRELAQRIGKDKDYIAGRLSLLKAPPEVQELVRQKPDALTAARRIAQLDDPAERKRLIEALLDGKINKETVRTSVRRSLKPEETDGEVVVRPDVQDAKAVTSKRRIIRYYTQSFNQVDFDGDMDVIRAVLDHWQQSLSSLDEDERAQLRVKIGVIQSRLKAMNKMLT